MAETGTKTATKRYAVVTGANKGIGLGICKQLASHGVVVVLTARDEKRGTEALDELKGSGLSDNVVFHQLDVANPASVASLAEFIKTQFGRLDILVNNAGILGTIVDGDILRAFMKGDREAALAAQTKCNDISTNPYELAEQCLQTNYYGAKRMTEELIPLLQLSDSPRIVNVSSIQGKLKLILNAWVKGVFSDAENLTEERVNEVLNEFLKDFKEGSWQAKGWPEFPSAYNVSKAGMNAYTRILAKKYPTFCINCVCPGYVKTDGNYNTGVLTVQEGAKCPVKLALLPDGGPSGQFFVQGEVSPF